LGMSAQMRSFFTRRTHFQGRVDAANRKSGLGKQSQQNGLMYEGEWRNGLRHGYGIVYKKVESTELYKKVYVGHWVDGMKHGLGIKYFSKGKYLGDWRKGQRSGRGFMWFDSGQFYMGQWQNDRFGGQGVFLEASGNRFHGSFKNGLKHGEGVYLHSRTGQIQRGIWEDGIFKMGTLEDWNRNQVLEPTIYPTPELKLANFPEVYQEWMAKYSELYPRETTSIGEISVIKCNAESVFM
ncbi:MORN repeat-containing protein 3-like, partial [Toxorhynchites rutilus septentrionalis]|uniref:MORN repeat-containing protein 3-like n=1 Tax=Toxorhynchites rutilus septentrionalis TaxID=329112 RepID=UPI00247AEC77